MSRGYFFKLIILYLCNEKRNIRCLFIDFDFYEKYFLLKLKFLNCLIYLRVAGDDYTLFKENRIFKE